MFTHALRSYIHCALHALTREQVRHLRSFISIVKMKQKAVPDPIHYMSPMAY